MSFLQNPETIFFPFFHIFSLEIFRASILWKCRGDRYLVSTTPPTVFADPSETLQVF